MRAGTTPIPATVSYNEATRTATLVPTDDLAGNTVHTAEVIARDVAGNLMPASVSWSFTTATPVFQQSTVLTGLTQPTVVEFAADGRVFIAEKSGLIKVFDNLSDTTATMFADLRTNVYNYHDRGLLGMALHPDFPDTPYVYVAVRARCRHRRHRAEVEHAWTPRPIPARRPQVEPPMAASSAPGSRA